MLRKVIIIGCPGAGKSTFARILSDKTHLPLYYLDMLWHKPDRTTVERNIFDKRLKEIISGDKWIIDFPKNELPMVYELLDRYKSQKSIYVFHSRTDIDDYLLKTFG